MTKNRIMQRILVFLLMVFFWSNISFSDQYNLIPIEALPLSDCVSMESSCSGSDCVPKNNTCPGYNISLVTDCQNGNLDVTTCFEIQFYRLSSVKMFASGDTRSEGALISCDEGTSNFDSCTKHGSFTVASDYNQATPNINKVAHYRDSGSVMQSSGNNVYCPMTRCDVRTDDIKFFVSTPDGQTTYTVDLPVGESYSVPIESQEGQELGSYGVVFSANQIGQNLCLTATTDIGSILIGCKQYPNTSTSSSSSSSSQSTDCFADTACASQNRGDSKVFWSVSSKVVQCVREVLNLVFINDNGCQNKNFFPGLQDNLRKAVMAALILYVALFGVKLVTGTDFFDTKVFFGFILKIALVLYFSVGLKSSDGNYHSGLSELVYPGGIAAMTSFSTFVLESTSDNGLCNYRPSDYPSGSEYLSIWDSLDCRVAYYLGLYLIKESSISGNDFVSGIFGIFGTVIPALLSLEFVFIVLVIVYGIFILSVVVYFVHFYVIALIAFTVTVYLGVITVPMALFSYTKQYFDAWLRVAISYVIQPVVVTTFLAFLMLVFDSVIYGNCQFESGQVFNGYNSWVIRDSTGCTDATDPRCSNCQETATTQCASVTACQDSIGWLMLGDLNSGFLDQKNAIFFSYTVLKNDVSGLVTNLLKVLLFVYLLSLFAGDLGNFAARLTDGPNIGKFARDPAALFRDIMNAISKGSGSKSKRKGTQKTGSKGIKVGGKKRSGINVSKRT